MFLNNNHFYQVPLFFKEEFREIIKKGTTLFF
jgi:hypothetical protein